MSENTRGLHVTQYTEECFSMSSIDIKFVDKELNEGEGSIAENILHVIRVIMYAHIQNSDYYKNGEFSNFMESPRYGEISFCLTPARDKKAILRLVQDLLLHVLGINLRKKSIIDIVGEERLPKMEEELAEAKAIVKDLLLDITMDQASYYHIKKVKS